MRYFLLSLVMTVASTIISYQAISQDESGCLPHMGTGCSIKQNVDQLPRDSKGDILLSVYDPKTELQVQHAVTPNHVKAFPEWVWPVNSPNLGLICFRVCSSENIGVPIEGESAWLRYCQAS
jgi:hypothetical protein